jgi:hypothetical protein
MSPRSSARNGEFAFRVDPQTREAEPLEAVDLASFGFWERRDLQAWIVDQPEIIEPDLLLVATEFDRWQVQDQIVADRLDVLFLDSDGCLLVAELKRGEAPDTTELQALKYAAFCSQLTRDESSVVSASPHLAIRSAAGPALIASWARLDVLGLTQRTPEAERQSMTENAAPGPLQVAAPTRRPRAPHRE